MLTNVVVIMATLICENISAELIDPNPPPKPPPYIEPINITASITSTNPTTSINPTVKSPSSNSNTTSHPVPKTIPPLDAVPIFNAQTGQSNAMSYWYFAAIGLAAFLALIVIVVRYKRRVYKYDLRANTETWKTP